MPKTDIRQEWGTPPRLIRTLQADYGPIVLDVCACSYNAVCPNYYVKAQDGLKQSWKTPDGTWAFCNPGFSSCKVWLRKAEEESFDGANVLVVTHASHADWAVRAWEHADECLLLHPRVDFVSPPGISSSANARETFVWVFRPHKRDTCLIRPYAWIRKGL